MTQVVLIDESPVVITDEGNGPGKLWHIICRCNEDIALCGHETTGDEIRDEVPSEDVCVVCDDLGDLPCPRCGL